MKWRSLVRRLIYTLVILSIISVIAFGLSRIVPGDEILDYLSIDESRYTSSANALEQRQAYARVAEKRGLDLPAFYVSIYPGYYPDSLYRIAYREDRKAVTGWAKTSGDPEGAMQLYHDLQAALNIVCPQADTAAMANKRCEHLGKLLSTDDFFTVHHGILQMQDSAAPEDTAWQEIALQLKSDVERLYTSEASFSLRAYLPSVQWHGLANQYHKWVCQLVTFTPVTSLIDGRNAWTKILEALKWTLLINGLAFILTIILGIIIGMWSGAHEERTSVKLVGLILFVLFAVPSFWLATLLVYLLASGEFLSVLPAGGLGPYRQAGSVLTTWGILASHLILPVVCLALGSIAYVSRQMKQSVIYQLKQPYVTALRAHGISEKTILRKHVFRNAIFPMITLIGGSLPALLSGSLIIEVIFSIPGMGRLMYSSLMARDWPVVFPILMLGACVTVIAYQLTDIIYKWADPRVKTTES